MKAKPTDAACAQGEFEDGIALAIEGRLWICKGCGLKYDVHRRIAHSRAARRRWLRDSHPKTRADTPDSSDPADSG